MFEKSIGRYRFVSRGYVAVFKGSPQGWPGSGSARADIAVRRLQPFTLLTPARLLAFDTGGIVAPVL